jgi:putative redox protein
LKTTVKWIDQVRFDAISENKHRITMDGPESHGGKNQGVRPMEMLLMGLGGCTSFDVMEILKKQRQSVESCEAHIDAQRADAVPSVFTKIHVHFVIKGHNLKEKGIAQAVQLSAEKYCSASIMLEKGGVDIVHSYEIIND